MSTHAAITRLSVPKIMKQKGKKPLVCLTAYHAYTAKIADDYCDLLLVGDSVSMVAHGLPSTLFADLEMMILHGKAVVRSTQKALIVVDMPFASYEMDCQTAFANAARLLKETGCDAVKLEGGVELAPIVAFLTQRGIPVMGHIGLRPQQTLMMGGYKTQGRDSDGFERLHADAQALVEAGVFSIVLEGIIEPIARRLTKKITVPTIGIGASVACDGQILVMEDMLGFSESVPKFVRRYAQLGEQMRLAIQAYTDDVHTRHFPSDDEIYQ